MKVLVFSIFAFLPFLSFENIELEENQNFSNPDSVVCTESSGDWICERFDDGGDCIIGLWEDGSVSTFGDDC